MNFNSYFTIKHTSNLRILLLTLFFIVDRKSTRLNSSHAT